MIYEIPVVERDVVVLSRRELRSMVETMPRDARRSRSRHERLPEQLRVLGASSRRSGS